MEQKSPNLIVLFLIAAIVVYAAMALAGPQTKIGTAWNSYRVQHGTENYQLDAYNDAVDNGINPTLFERQINQESGFNPHALSNKGAIGIAQIMPATAQGWGIDPHDPVASLSAAAQHMALYQNAYGDYAKALACYNAGCGTLDSAIARCGDSWKSCLPPETQAYVAAIGG